MNNYLEIIKLLLQGMIDKNASVLSSVLASNSKLIHMTGLVESKEEYIKDILNGTLNYYDYEIESVDENKAVIKLLAKVYGGSKSWWRLAMYTKYIKEDGNLKILESKVINL